MRKLSAVLACALCAAGMSSWCTLSSAATPGAATSMIELENTLVRYVIGPDGKNRHFIDKSTGADYCRPGTPFASVTVEDKEYPAVRATLRDGLITVTFEPVSAGVVVRPDLHDEYMSFEVVSVEGEGVDRLTFLHIPLTVKGRPEEPSAACALALNLHTNVPELPGPNSLLRAHCRAKLGMVGAAAAVVACPQAKLRDMLKHVVSQAPDLPKSPIGGPWAMDAEINRSSYLFLAPNEATVDAHIARLKSLGFNQVEIHGGGGTYRFGDCEPNENLYPKGVASVKATIDKLHAAGIYAGMHPYAFFIDKSCPWVTPVPDKRLAKDVTFTLASDLSEQDTSVSVVEATKDMSTITGFFVRNSVTLHVDDELITYSDISREPPYAFTKCQRGAWGTRVASHKAGAPVHHLKECFGLFVPDPETSLLAEVAAKNAEFFNECGFDCLYLDALDGEDILGGGEYGWYYGSKYVYELWKRLAKPATMEYSTFHHHLWYLRSRHGAWDHPSRSHRKFIDLHVSGNRGNERMFLPSNLGWWAFKSWGGAQVEPTFPEDIEYWCVKALGTDSGLSITSYDPGQPGHQRLAAIVKQCEALRHAGYFDAGIKEQLRVPGADFTLQQAAEGRWQLRPARYPKHKALAADERTLTWKVDNPFAEQPAGIRIEALHGTARYDSEEAIILAGFERADELPVRRAAAGVEVRLDPAPSGGPDNAPYGRLRATNSRDESRGSWACIGKTFSPPLNLTANQGLGVWVHGDGKGEVLNFQVRSPSHLSNAAGEHYVIVDFTGWRYFTLVETDTEAY